MTHLLQAMLDELERRNYAKTTVQYYMELHPPYDSTPILIRRVRRKRQRLRSNGSIESDPARQRRLSPAPRAPRHPRESYRYRD